MAYDISVALNKIIIYGLQEEPKNLSFYYESDDEITEIYDVIWNTFHKVNFFGINYYFFKYLIIVWHNFQ